MPQVPQGRFNVTFSLVRKSNQKVHQRSAALWTPGERFKALHKRTLDINCSFPCLKQLSGFEPVRDANFHQTQNRVLWKIEVAVRAWRRKQSMKRDSARYLCCGGKGKLVCADRKFSAKMQFTCVWETQNFAILHQTFRSLRKLLYVPQKVKFSPNQPILWNT